MDWLDLVGIILSVASVSWVIVIIVLLTTGKIEAPNPPKKDFDFGWWNW